jgi:predicted phosphodiesterase
MDEGDAGITAVETRVGVLSDVHGELRTLTRALAHCCETGVGTIALLGDLFDKVEEADRCAAVLDGWQVVGVYGNHEREIALAAAAGEIEVEPFTLDLLTGLSLEVRTDEYHLVHEAEPWGQHDPVAALFERSATRNGYRPASWITFAGHTHVRSARTESGPLDIARGRLKLSAVRNYLINPGALSVGQYAIWDREEHYITFHQLEDW